MFDSMQNAEIIGTLTKEFNEVRKERQRGGKMCYDEVYKYLNKFWK